LDLPVTSALTGTNTTPLTSRYKIPAVTAMILIVPALKCGAYG
jgi:hypothetical protein